MKLGTCTIGSYRQSSCASRFTAGDFGFLTLIQCDVRPERYGEPSRFDTIPSQPSLQTCLKITAPSPLKCSFKTRPCCGLRRSRASRCLRCSIGTRRKSSPSISSRSKAHRIALAWLRERRINSNTARPLSSQAMASPSIKQERPGSAATAAVASGNRLVKSFPLRVISRTPAASRPKPSSCRHEPCLPSPAVGRGAGRFDSRDQDGGLRSRNKTMGKI